MTLVYVGEAVIVRALARLRSRLPALTDEQRVEIFAKLADGYCRACGRATATHCHCENDE